MSGWGTRWGFDHWDEDKTITGNFVTIEKIQYNDGTEYVDVPDPLYVLKGDTVSFKAIPNPEGATWPQSKPAWGGTSGATGTGSTKSVTFNTGSSSSSDYKTVTAECGATRTANVVVMDILADLKFRGYTLGVGAYVAEWLDELTAVSGDVITLEAAGYEGHCSGTTYAWDSDASFNVDSTDANKDGTDEDDDDTEDTAPVSAVSYNPLPNQEPNPDSRTVTLNISYDDTFAGSDQGTVNLYEALVVQTSGLPQSEAPASLLYMEYLVQTLTDPGTALFELLPFRNVFVFFGHGSSGSFQSGGEVVTPANVGIYRKLVGTPMGGERTYKFVFLNCCESAWGATDWKEAWAAQSFLGWIGSVGDSHASAFDSAFWGYVQTGDSVASATSKAAADASWWYAVYGIWDPGYTPENVHPEYDGSIVLSE